MGGAYRVLPYFMAKSCSDCLATIVLPVVYCTVVYWCAGLRADAFVGTLAIFFLGVTTAQSFAIMISCAVPDFATANVCDGDHAPQHAPGGVLRAVPTHTSLVQVA